MSPELQLCSEEVGSLLKFSEVAFSLVQVGTFEVRLRNVMVVKVAYNYRLTS
jgi:hypothetical protein